MLSGSASGIHQKLVMLAHQIRREAVLNLTLSQADLAEIDRIMAGAIPVGGPTPEGMT